MAPRFETVLEEHGPALARVAASYARPGADRDDLLQEIAVALWRALPRFRQECSLRTFVLRIAHNRGLAFLWRTRARSTAPEAAAAEVADPAPGPDARADGPAQEGRVAAAVCRLPLGLRQVLTLALEGLAHTEIAEVLGIDINLVAVRLHRARAALSLLLEERHDR